MKPPQPNAPKTQWRAWARSVRSNLDHPTWSSAVVRSLEASKLIPSEGWIASYLSMEYEPDLSALHGRLQGRIAVPRIAGTSESMTFHALTSHLQQHAFGMQQPDESAPTIGTDAITLILVPGLAFDHDGFRLGYGGGFYDKWLRDVPLHVPRIGITHAQLWVPRLPHEPHDQTVSHIASSDGVFDV